MAKQRISYVPLEKMDAAMRAEMERCAREGTPRPESTAVRAHVPSCFWFFANSWNDIFSQRHPRPCAEGSSASLRFALGDLRVLRQPALDQGRERRAAGSALRRSHQFRKISQVQRPGKRLRSPMPKRSSGGSTPMMRSGSACISIFRNRSWSSWVARSGSRSASRAGCGCSISSTIR